MADISNSPFFDSGSQRRINPLTFDPGQFPPGQPTPTHPLLYQIPTVGREQVDLTNILKTNLEVLVGLGNQTNRSLGGINNLLNRTVQHYDNMVNSAQQLNIETQKGAEQNQQMIEFAQARERAEKQVNAAMEKGLNSLRTQFQLAGMLKKEKITYADSQGRPRSIDLNQFSSLPQEQQDLIKRQVVSGIASASPGKASFSQAFQHILHGNLGAAVGELVQALPGTSGFAMKAAEKGAAIQAGAGEGMTGMLQRGLGGLVASGGEFLVSPAAVYLVQREVRQGIRAYQENLRTGMQTGLQGGSAVTESIGANIRAHFEALNPFDALTTSMAEQISKGIMSEGFSGPIRAAWQDSVTDVVKQTGLDASQALQLMTTAVDQLGSSADQFRSNMGLVELTSKQTTLSVEQAAQSMQALQSQFAPKGGAAGAQAVAPGGQVFQSQITKFSRIAGAGLAQRLIPAIGQNWQMLVTRAGLNPADAFTPQVEKQFLKVLDANGQWLWNLKNSNPLWRNMGLGLWVGHMEGMSPQLFDTLLGPGVQNSDVVAFMNATKGHGLEVQQAKTAADQLKTETKPQAQHRGFFGGLLHGGLHVITAGTHEVGNIASIPGKYLGKGVAETLRDVGVPKDLANQIGGISGETGGDLVPGALFKHLPIYNDYSFSKTQNQMLKVASQQLNSLNIPSKYRDEILAPLREANSIDQLRGSAAKAYQDQVVKIEIDLHPNAKKLILARTDPSSQQKYHDSRSAKSGTQGMPTTANNSSYYGQ